MMKFLQLCLVGLLAVHTAWAQDTMTTYINGHWRTMVETDGLWWVEERSTDYSLQMKGSYSSLDPKVKEGLFVYFHENGNKRMEGHYAQNVKVGPWSVWYEDGTLSDRGAYTALDAYPASVLESAWSQQDAPGIRVGAWEYFYESGHLSSRINWENSEAVLLEYFNEDGSIPYEAPVLEMLPEFPGGEQALMHFLGSNVRYPEADKAAGVSGQVVIQFTVQKDGTVADPKIVKSVSPTIDAECIRLVNNMPDWIPGYQNNRPVSVEYTLPIGFKANTYPANSKKYRR